MSQSYYLIELKLSRYSFTEEIFITHIPHDYEIEDSVSRSMETGFEKEVYKVMICMGIINGKKNGYIFREILLSGGNQATHQRLMSLAHYPLSLAYTIHTVCHSSTYELVMCYF